MYLSKWAVPGGASTAPTTTGPATTGPEGTTGVGRFGNYEDILETRLQEKAEQNFELGAAYFRSGEMLKARHHFELAGDVWLDKPQPYIAGMLASYELNDFNRAIGDLTRALELAKALDHLKIDDFLNKFYNGEDLAAQKAALGRAVDSVNLLVKSSGEAGGPANLLLAYYSWLNGDSITAAAAAESAARVFPEPTAKHIRKFHGWLLEEQQSAGPSETAPK
jgi:tetratricopeptide (TPR) repeat protein